MYRKRRSLSRRISQSQRVNRLSDRGALLYTWLIPQYDDEGRIDGDPEDVRYNVFPRRGVSTKEVVGELLAMDEMGLIHWYVVDGRPYIEMVPEAWEEHQTFSGVKRTSSVIPAYDPGAHEKYRDFAGLEGSPPGTVDQSTGDSGPVHRTPL